MCHHTPLPLGLYLALTEDKDASEKFFSLPPHAQQSVIRHAGEVSSPMEMRQYVRNLQEKEVL